MLEELQTLLVEIADAKTITDINIAAGEALERLNLKIAAERLPAA